VSAPSSPGAGSKWIRQAHRWLAVAFTALVLANFAVMGRETIAPLVGGFTLLPLALLLFSGLYLFALPYAKRRGGDAR